MLRPYQEQIISLMEEHELLLAAFYELLAEKFPEHKEFWLGLAHDEKTHAAVIVKLRNRASLDMMRFNEGTMKTYTIQTSIAYIQGNMDKARAGALTLVAALVVAKTMESAMIEKNFFRSFISDDEEVVAFFLKLQDATSEHLNRVREKLETMQNS